MPPKDTEPSELFAKLLEMPRPTEVIDFPRTDAQGNPVGQVRIQILTSLEHDKARELAHGALKKRGIDKDDMSAPAIREVLGDAIAKELIAMACLGERDYAKDGEAPIYQRVFRGSRDVDALGADEILVLFNAYQLVQNKYGPFERNLSDSDVDAWIERLGEGGSAFPLLNLALPQLVLLAQSLAVRHSTLCHIMASQLSSLPPSSVALLEPFLSGITFAGEPADGTEPLGSARKDRPLTPITTEAAAEIAAKMRERG